MFWRLSSPTSTTWVCATGEAHFREYFGPAGTKLLMSVGPLVDQTQKAQGERALNHPPPPELSRKNLLEVDVGTDESVVEEEDFSLPRSENLTFVIKNHLRQQLRVNKAFLVRGQQLQTQEPWEVSALPPAVPLSPALDSEGHVCA